MSNQKNKPKISMIAVISKSKRALGLKKELLWKIQGDLPRFKALTTGHPIIMGRLTYESIGRPLPNRTNIIVSKSSNINEIAGLIVTSSIDEALEKARAIDNDEIFIIGGGQIYSQTINQADRLYLTIVDDEPLADTFFPEYSDFKKEIFMEKHSEHNPPFSYVILEK